MSLLVPLIATLLPPTPYLYDLYTLPRNTPPTLSPLVIHILITSNILRILFYYCNLYVTTPQHFPLELLLQSILMVIVIGYYYKLSKGFNTSLVQYYIYATLLTAVITNVGIRLRVSDILSPVIGSLSLGLESLIPLPQLVSNFREKRVGVSWVIVGSWFIGM